MSAESPTPYELWRQAGGGTPDYDRALYRSLLTEHGHLIPLKPGEKPEPLPCGWPHTSAAEPDLGAIENGRDDA